MVLRQVDFSPYGTGNGLCDPLGCLHHVVHLSNAVLVGDHHHAPLVLHLRHGAALRPQLVLPRSHQAGFLADLASVPGASGLSAPVQGRRSLQRYRGQDHRVARHRRQHLPLPRPGHHRNALLARHQQPLVLGGGAAHPGEPRDLDRGHDISPLHLGHQPTAHLHVRLPKVHNKVFFL